MDNFEIIAYGHKNILATHKSTWELTKANNLSKRGDCIIGINANFGPIDFPQWFKEELRKNERIDIELICGDEHFTGSAMGNDKLELSHKEEIVIRKSEFLSDRTVAIMCDFAAKDIPRSMIEKLKSPNTELRVIFSK